MTLKVYDTQIFTRNENDAFVFVVVVVISSNYGKNDVMLIDEWYFNIQFPTTFSDNLFPLFLLDKNNSEREKGRERIKVQWEYNREGCHKNC